MAGDLEADDQFQCQRCGDFIRSRPHFGVIQLCSICQGWVRRVLKSQQFEEMETLPVSDPFQLNGKAIMINFAQRFAAFVFAFALVVFLARLMSPNSGGAIFGKSVASVFAGMISIMICVSLSMLYVNRIATTTLGAYMGTQVLRGHGIFLAADYDRLSHPEEHYRRLDENCTVVYVTFSVRDNSSFLGIFLSKPIEFAVLCFDQESLALFIGRDFATSSKLSDIQELKFRQSSILNPLATQTIEFREGETLRLELNFSHLVLPQVPNSVFAKFRRALAQNQQSEKREPPV